MFQYVVRPWAIAIVACLLTWAAAPTQAAEAVFAITPPTIGWDSTVEFDLGVPLLAIIAISVVAEGTATIGLHGRECPGGPSVTCDDPIVAMRRWAISVSDDEYLGSPTAGGSWLSQWDGPFAVNDVLAGVGSGFLADGKGIIRYEDSSAFFDSQFLLDCDQQGCTCTQCVRGELHFATPILVKIEYNPAVPTTNDSWGQVKAVYR